MRLSGASIVRDDLDIRIARQPGLNGRNFSIREKRHDPTSFEIADDRSIAMISAHAPIANSDHPVTGTQRSHSPDLALAMSMITGNVTSSPPVVIQRRSRTPSQVGGNTLKSLSKAA